LLVAAAESQREKPEIAVPAVAAVASLLRRRGGNAVAEAVEAVEAEKSEAAALSEAAKEARCVEDENVAP
jgi:hypothetical protein